MNWNGLCAVPSRVPGKLAAAAFLAIILLASGCRDGSAPRSTDMFAAFKAGRGHAPLALVNPPDGVLYPRDIAPPTFRWKAGPDPADLWYVAAGDGLAFSPPLSAPEWTPNDDQWEAVKQASLDAPVTVSVIGTSRRRPRQILAATTLSIRTSRDAVEAPLFYREVNLPFRDAVKDPSRIRWRFGTVSSRRQPPIVLDALPVCGNCHSFSADGAVFGMDVDYANDKGSYAIAPVSEEIVLDDGKIITWDDYRKEARPSTFGLLSQVSPSGRYVVSTVKDRSVFVPKPDLAYSQLFFPLKGILVIYDRHARTFASLPGADDPEYVQSNPAWSPDEKTLVFARAKAHPLKVAGARVLLTEDECAEFLKEEKTFRFDLYRVPFNGGKGGVPEPLAGASTNGLSNFFPRYSPDGRWIVFCRARNYMLLQPDSELWIVPADGGKARRLACNNVAAMNSWHTWSPNSRWLAWSSKLNGPYTQVFLAHIDADGNSSPPILLDWFTSPDRAANIPEFVAATPSAIRKIRERFIDEVSFFRAGREFAQAGDNVNAETCYRRALDLNPRYAQGHDSLGYLLFLKGDLEQARAHFLKAIEYDPKLATAFHNLGNVCLGQRNPREAIPYFENAIAIDAEFFQARSNLGTALQSLGRIDEAVTQFQEAIRINPGYPMPYYKLGTILQSQGKIEDAVIQYRKAVEFGGDQTPARHRLSALQR